MIDKTSPNQPFDVPSDVSSSPQPQEPYLPIEHEDQPTSKRAKIRRFLFGKPGKIFSIFILGFVSLALIFAFLAYPHRVKGEPIELFKKDGYVLSEKISYLFQAPRVGDRVIFVKDDNGFDFLGIITDVESENGIKKYTILSSPGKQWTVAQDRIERKIYFPFVNQAQIQSVITTITPSPTPEISPSSTEPTVVPGSTSVPTSAPTIPPLRSVSISGFAYEDRSDDGLFNSDDPKLPYMQFYLYDSFESEKQISTIYSNESGDFSIKLNVRGDLIVKPTTYNNFRPRGGQLEFATSTSGIEFGFRSVGAPVASQVGIIEGDVFQDSNRNGARDGGEQGIYFYKLYLLDSSNNYYNTDRNTQTTDSGGHFKFVNLPTGRSYTLRLSNPTRDYIIDRSETSITLTSSQTQFAKLQIPVFKTN